MTIQTYDMVYHGYEGGELKKKDFGEWVLFEDVAKLVAEILEPYSGCTCPEGGDCAGCAIATFSNQIKYPQSTGNQRYQKTGGK